MLDIFDLLFPTLCTGCRSYGILLCGKCMESISPVSQMCIGCQSFSATGQTCAACLRINTSLPDRLFCATNYKEDLPSKIITTLKYVGIKDLSAVCARIIASEIEKELPYEMIFAMRKSFSITYVPMHKNKQVARGFNQSRLIAEELGRIWDMPVIDTLAKTRKTAAQMSLNREQRLQNLKGAFSAFSGQGQNLILIDDVITTGSTMQECAKELKRAGTDQIHCIAFAKD